MTLSRRRVVAALAVCPLAAGCARTLQPMGPVVGPPRLDGAALVMADGARLPYRRWGCDAGGPPTAVILALHGFGDYSNAFDQPARAFAAAGIVTYAYDQRGFGATRAPGVWAGTPTLLDDAATALALVTRAHPGVPVFLLGESMGGAVALALMTGPSPPPVAGVVLVSPAIWGFDTMNLLPKTTLRLANALVPGLVVRPPPDLHIRASDNIEMLRALGRDPLVLKDFRVDALYGLTALMGLAMDGIPRLRGPGLVLFGAHEEVLPADPVAEAITLFQKRPGVRVAVYPEGFHMLLRDLHAGVPVADVAAWVADPLAPLPSGDERAAAG